MLLPSPLLPPSFLLFPIHLPFDGGFRGKKRGGKARLVMQGYLVRATQHGRRFRRKCPPLQCLMLFSIIPLHWSPCLVMFSAASFSPSGILTSARPEGKVCPRALILPSLPRELVGHTTPESEDRGTELGTGCSERYVWRSRIKNNHLNKMLSLLLLLRTCYDGHP